MFIGKLRPLLDVGDSVRGRAQTGVPRMTIGRQEHPDKDFHGVKSTGAKN